MACVTAAAIAAMTAEAFRSPGERMPIGPLGLIGLLGAGAAAILLWDRHATSFGVVVADNFGLFVTWILIAVGLLALAISGPTIERERLPAGEYYALMLFAIAAMMLMATATDLLVIFLALEVLSLAVYVLTGIRRDNPSATEAAFKYFLLGGFSSAFFLYGIAFTYGVTGSTRLERIGSLIAAQSTAPTPMQLLAVGLLLVGFAFKVSAVPFQMWTPDAYEGAPAAVTGFMSTGVKAAAFGAFVRVFLAAFEPLRGEWSDLVWVIAAATMIVGSVVGVVQSNVKRMLAYSSIAHAGYALIGLVAGTPAGGAALLFYLVVYTFMNVGAFGVLLALSRSGERNERLSDLAGVGLRHPVLGVAMTVCMLSLAGMPLTAGFTGKFYLFSAALDAGCVWLVVIAVLNSLVSVAYYLGVLIPMYMQDGTHEIVPPTARPWLLGTVLLAVAMTLLIGIDPSGPMHVAQSAFASLR